MGRAVTEKQKRRFRKGDVIKVRNVISYISPVPIWHYGVMVGYDDVVHFNLVEVSLNAGFDIHVVRTDLQQFVGHGKSLHGCCMSLFDSNFDRETIARRALSMVGTDFGGYDLLRNNCEHFAHWCACGEPYSNQIPTDEGAGHSLGSKLAAAAALPIVEAVDTACDALQNLNDAADALFDNLPAPGKEK